MILINNQYSCRVDLFGLMNSGHYYFIKSIEIKVIHDKDKTIKEVICEGIRKSLLQPKSALARAGIACYDHENAIASVPSYPMQSGYINISSPMLIEDWKTFGLEE